MVLRELIKGGVENLRILPDDLLPHIRDLLGPLIDEKDHKMHIRFIPEDGLCDLL